MASALRAARMPGVGVRARVRVRVRASALRAARMPENIIHRTDRQFVASRRGTNTNVKSRLVTSSPNLRILTRIFVSSPPLLTYSPK